MGQLLPHYGGDLASAADVTFLAPDQVGDDLWDEIAIAKSPTRAMLFETSTADEWQSLALHRTTGLAGPLGIETIVRRR